jgi:hypothetical protein
MFIGRNVMQAFVTVHLMAHLLRLRVHYFEKNAAVVSAGSISFGRRKNPPMRTDGLWANGAGLEGDDMRMNGTAQRYRRGGMFRGCLTDPQAGYTRGRGVKLEQEVCRR